MIEKKYIKSIVSDFWKAYQKLIPKEKHIASKSQTYTVEGYNSNMRTSSLPVKALSSKAKKKNKVLSKKMLEISIKLFMLKRNNQLSRFF